MLELFNGVTIPVPSNFTDDLKGYPGKPRAVELYDLQADPDENNNLHGKPEYESLTLQLAARLEVLRRQTGDEYVYHPSRTPHLRVIMGPPEEPGA